MTPLFIGRHVDHIQGDVMPSHFKSSTPNIAITCSKLAGKPGSWKVG